MTGIRQRLTGRITVGLPPGEAFRLFTPRGEQDWAHDWHPYFPAPVADDAEPGTVFETHAHGQHTIWLVTGREAGKRISYARVTPGDQAGTVTVTISPSGGHGEVSDVEVTYQLTALTSAADRELREFAGGYPGYLRSWQEAIASWLGNPDHDLPRHGSLAACPAATPAWRRRGTDRRRSPRSSPENPRTTAGILLASPYGRRLAGDGHSARCGPSPACDSVPARP